MNRIPAISTILLTLVSSLFAQVNVRPLNQMEIEERIHRAVYDTRIIDTHEHFYSEELVLTTYSLDFCNLFLHYQADDFISAGLKDNKSNLLEILRGRDISEDEKWLLVKDFWKDTRTNGYGRAAIAAASGLFGVDDINDQTYKDLSKKVRELHKAGFYKQVLVDKAKIDICIIMNTKDLPPRDMDQNYFRSLFGSDWFCRFVGYQNFQKVTEAYKRSDVTSLDDYGLLMDSIFNENKKKNFLGLKVGWAYGRTLQCDDVSEEVAINIFQEMKDNPQKKYSMKEAKPLQDYLFNRVLELCEKYDFPVQIHSGLQTGNGGDITNTNPLNLISTFLKFPKVRFSILHSSYPYGGELAALAKTFPNVYIDMAWTTTISPSFSIRYLQEFIETVPSNKIMVFGGDCSTVESAYGASMVTRDVVEKTLVMMLDNGYLNEIEALELVKKLLRENAINFYKLNEY